MPKVIARKVTLRDIADRASVSIAAASMALANHPEISPETKSRVLQLSQKMGYASPRERHRAGGRLDGDRSRREPRKGRVGWLLIGASPEDAVFAGVIQSLTNETARDDLRLEMLSLPDCADHDAATRVAQRAATLDGLLLTGLVGASLLEVLRKANVPHVVLGHAMLTPAELNDFAVQVVASDEIGMGETATTALLSQGHQRIGFVCEKLYPGLSHARWQAGYAAAMVAARLPVHPTWVHTADRLYAGGDAAAAAMAALPESKRPTAFVVPDVRIGVSFLSAMRLHGIKLAPEQIVVGGQEATIRLYSFEAYPQIIEDLTAVASLGLKHLRRLIDHPVSYASEIRVPFLGKNLP